MSVYGLAMEWAAERERLIRERDEARAEVERRIRALRATAGWQLAERCEAAERERDALRAWAKRAAQVMRAFCAPHVEWTANNPDHTGVTCERCVMFDVLEDAPKETP